MVVGVVDGVIVSGTCRWCGSGCGRWYGSGCGRWCGSEW